ncbi:MAG: flagellar motor switch protein FliG [Oscillospiraceae bacterium]|jgi:flagellar motor switch protein FliG|nr:flagellar motor switch protein FliG [Oscillospiraceae bacterium]
MPDYEYDYELTSREKAAVLLVSLGKNFSAEIFRQLNEDEVSDLTLNIATLRRVPSEQRERVVEEFYQMCLVEKFAQEGGIDYARELLQASVGAEKAEELLGRLSYSLQVRPFGFVRRIDADQLLQLLHNEHPQTIALVLSYTDPKQASEVVSKLPPDSQADIIRRISGMGVASPEYIKEAEAILERSIASMGFSEQAVPGGIDAIVGIFNELDRGSEKSILEILDREDQALAEEIRAHLFVFEDLIKLTNQAVQRVLKEVNNSDLAIALKSATDDVKKLIFGNISARMKEMLEDDMEIMGPLRIRDVEDAQQRIVSVVRRLEEENEITVSRGEEDVMIG